MKKFYLYNEMQQQGPFDIEELKAKNITKDSPIWYEGLSEWTTAKEVDDLKDLFKTVNPPPFEANKITTPSIQRKNVPEEKASHYSNIKKKNLVVRFI